MSDPRKPGDAPGAPLARDVEAPETVVVTETVAVVATPVEPGTTRAGDDGAPVDFTPDDVHFPPPDRPPTEEAPESEKAGLIFERS